MKKKLALLLMTGALSLTGCSGENNIGDQLVKTYVMKTSGIENDVDYQKYVEYKERGLLSEDGEYNKLEKEQNQIDNAALKKRVCQLKCVSYLLPPLFEGCSVDSTDRYSSHF